MSSRRRTAALLEVLGVYLAGSLVTRLFSHALDLHVPNPLATFRVDIGDDELVAASGRYLVLLLLQYAGWFVLLVALDWWRGRRGAAVYGLTKAGRSWTALLVAGGATAALAAWPVFGIAVLDNLYDLGPTAPWRQALFDTSWRRWQFWLFTAVMSWGVVAIAEELFFRGYCQRRLAEEWGDGPAIVGVACLFTFAHGQYLRLDPYNLGMTVSLFTLALGFGVVFAWTRSIVPSMVAHAIINVTMTPFWLSVVLIVFLIVAALAARRAAGVIEGVFRGATTRGGAAACFGLAVVCAAYALAAGRISHLSYVAAGMLLIAVILTALDRWTRGAASPAQPAA
jgi:membrane protease YdiL (CAAX protease family)